MADKLRSAIELLRQLIAEVEALPTVPEPGSAGTADSVTSSVRSSNDAGWEPTVPPGHTAFSWGIGAAGGGDAAWDPSIPQGHTPFSWGKHLAATSSQPQTQAKQENQAKNQKNQQQPAKEKQQGKQQGKQQDKQQGKQQGKEQGKEQGKQGKQQAKQQGKPDASESSAPHVPLFYRLDIRVGKIVKAWKHSNADTMYVELIDLGEDEPRQVCSGLYVKIPPEKFEGSMVLCCVNLKPSDLRGKMSYGMVLAASNSDKSVVELVQPPKDAPVGARIYLDGDADSKLEEWMGEKEINAKNKKSAWALISPLLKVDSTGIVTFEGRALRTLDGPITSPTLRDVHVG
eukprot:g5718.t1